MLKKIVIIVLLNFFIFFSVGVIAFNKAIYVNDKLDPFLNSIANKKIGLYYFDLESMQKLHKYVSIEIVNSTGIIKRACYEINADSLKMIPECKDDVQIILDEHAASTIILGSMRPFNVLFSEFLMGHIRFKGLTINDFLMVLKW